MTNPSGLLGTRQADLFFEDNAVGRLKQEIWDASDQQIDVWLQDYGTPSPCEWTKPGLYIQTTVRHQVEANRRKLAPYLKEPFSPGWKSVYGLPAVGQL